MWLTLWKKTVLLIYVAFCWFDQKLLFKEIQIFLRICPFTHGKKKNSEYYDAVSAIVILYLKRKVLYKFPPKCFKTTERHSLRVCGSLCGEKQFLLIIIPFYWFNQKLLFKQLQIFL